MAKYVDLSERVSATFYSDEYEEWTQQTVTIADVLDSVCDDYMVLPSAQPEQTDCEYCHEDSDGCVRSIEKNSHAWLVRRGKAMRLRVGSKGEYRECDILFCPMCGRRLTDG